MVNPARAITNIAIMHEHASMLYKANGPSELDFQIVDARAESAFQGTDPAPKPGHRCGSIKNALNAPSGTVLMPDGSLKSDEDLAALWHSRGVSMDK